MKARLQGKIVSVANKDGDTEVAFETAGKVQKGQGPLAPSARQTSLKGTVMLKGVVASEMKIGAVLTVTISDEEADERLD
jgi:hypothetical protein